VRLRIVLLRTLEQRQQFVLGTRHSLLPFE
jgi:hypothetical protein